MAEEVKADTPVEGQVGKDGKKKGKESGFGKYKWWIIAGAIIVVILIVVYMHSQSNAASQANNQASNATNGNIDPATGYPYGSPADLAALGSSGSIANQPVTGDTGPTGPAGPAGPTGPAGPQGKPGGSATSPHPCPQGMRYDYARKQCVPFGTFGPVHNGKDPHKKAKGGPKNPSGGGH